MSDIKQTFSTPPPSAFASYNYTDIAEGTGVSIFYGIIGPGITDFNLISNLDDGSASNRTYSGAASPGTTYTMATISSFNQPKTIKGNASIICNSNWDTGSGGSTIFKLYKVDGVTAAETLVGTLDTISNSASGAVQRYTFGTTTETHFKRGDSLRLKITVIVGGSVWRISASTTNPFKLYIPFKLTDL